MRATAARESRHQLNSVNGNQPQNNPITAASTTVIFYLQRVDAFTPNPESSHTLQNKFHFTHQPPCHCT
jgi:hypothetical protein